MPAVAEGELGRLGREIEDLLRRVRQLENVDTPAQRRAITELHDLQGQIARMEREGTTATAIELVNIRATLARIELQMATKDELKFTSKRLEDLEDDTKTNRRSARAALIGASLALGGGLLLFLIERAISK